MKNRIFAAFSAVSLLFTMAACSSGSGSQNLSASPAFEEPATVSVMFPRGDKLFNPDWVVWEYIQSASGAQLDLRPATANYESALATAFASPDSKPDLVVFNKKSLADEYASNGSLIAIEDISEQMPNWALFWSNISAEERNALFKVRKYADGKTYWPARYGFPGYSNIKTWMYRRDIFDQHGLDTPSTYDELYEVAVRLKELYPDSYPIGCENFFSYIALAAGPQWKRNFECWEYYDFSADKWCFGASEDAMLDMITTFKRFYDEGLISPNFTATTAHEFSELVKSGQTFIFPHMQSRMEDFILDSFIINRSFDLGVMAPPVANTRTGKPLMINSRIDSSGMSIVNSGDSARISNAIKLFDWFYSSTAYDLLSWGKEGETYEKSDGIKRFILSFGEDLRSKYGLQTYVAAQAVHPEAVMTLQFRYNTAEDVKTLLSSLEADLNPRSWISFTDEEKDFISSTGSAIRSYARECIGKFLSGEKPLSEWDSYVEELYDMDLEELLEVYETAYNRVK